MHSIERIYFIILNGTTFDHILLLLLEMENMLEATLIYVHKFEKEYSIKSH